jgi:methionyl-tRNA formyltransferase
MNVVVIGRQDFGRAVLDAFHARGDTISGVFCAPDKEGAKADCLFINLLRLKARSA